MGFNCGTGASETLQRQHINIVNISGSLRTRHHKHIDRFIEVRNVGKQNFGRHDNENIGDILMQAASMDIERNLC